MTSQPGHPAGELRFAAAALRIAARGATGGPWLRAADAGDAGRGYPPDFIARWSGDHVAGVATTWEGENPAANARYIALMDPGPGLAIADWLDATAVEMHDLLVWADTPAPDGLCDPSWWCGRCKGSIGATTWACRCWEKPLEVARRILKTAGTVMLIPEGAVR